MKLVFPTHRSLAADERERDRSEGYARPVSALLWLRHPQEAGMSCRTETGMKMGHTVGVAREERSLSRRCSEPAQEADRGCVQKKRSVAIPKRG